MPRLALNFYPLLSKSIVFSVPLIFSQFVSQLAHRYASTDISLLAEITVGAPRHCAEDSFRAADS